MMELSKEIEEILSQEFLKNIVVEKDNITRPARLIDLPDNFINMCIVDYLLSMRYSAISKAEIIAPDGGKVKVI